MQFLAQAWRRESMAGAPGLTTWWQFTNDFIGDAIGSKKKIKAPLFATSDGATQAGSST
jgi:hypothetical protein